MIAGTHRSPPTEERAAATLAVLAAEVGLDRRDARLIKLTANAVYHLPREQVVVRMPATPTLLHRVGKVVAVARWLAAEGVPAVRLLPGLEQPVRVDDTLATVWEYVRPTGPAPQTAELGPLLRQWHALGDPPFELPQWDPIDDVRRRLDDAQGLDDGDLEFLVTWCEDVAGALGDLRWALRPGPIHGDAHVGNLIRGPDGQVVICDFDPASHGPREWDLVPVAVGAYRFGNPRGHADLVRAYGFDVTRSPAWPLLRAVRELKLVTSVVPILAGSPRKAAQFRHRLRSIRQERHRERWQTYG